MKRLIIFRCVDSAIPQLYCLKFSFKSIDISKCYARTVKGLFSFSNRVYSIPVVQTKKNEKLRV